MTGAGEHGIARHGLGGSRLLVTVAVYRASTGYGEVTVHAGHRNVSIDLGK